MNNLFIEGMEGCTDGGCLFERSTGMHTNGGCRCLRELSRTDDGRKAVRLIHFLREQIKRMENLE